MGLLVPTEKLAELIVGRRAEYGVLEIKTQGVRSRTVKYALDGANRAA